MFTHQPKLSLHDRIVQAFISHGFVRVYGLRTAKYICYKSPKTGLYYFLGKHGAVRCNKVCRVTGAVSVKLASRFITAGIEPACMSHMDNAQ